MTSWIVAKMHVSRYLCILKDYRRTCNFMIYDHMVGMTSSWHKIRDTIHSLFRFINHSSYAINYVIKFHHHNVMLSFHLCRPLTWIEERGPGLPRAKNINFQFDSCTLTQIPPAPRGAVGLFMQDLIHFSAKLVDQVSPEEIQRERVRILHCLELAEKIQRLCQS